MDIVSVLLLITLALGAHYVAIIFQVVALSRLYQSKAWMILASGWILVGALHTWNTARLPIALTQAKLRGAIPDGLTPEQWIRIAGLFITLWLFIIGHDRLRRDLRKLGI